jgi:hypothetical protein
MGNSARKMARQKAKQLVSPIYGNKSEMTKLPFGPCFMSETRRRDVDVGMPELVSAMVTRVLPSKQFVAGFALVDRTCLGVKDAYRSKPMGIAGLQEYLEHFSSVHLMVEVEPLEVLSVVHHAIEYAEKLGFQPHQDYPSEIFGERPETLLDTLHASDPKPFYVSGLDDDVEEVLRKLDETVGPGNYDFVTGADLSDLPF